MSGSPFRVMAKARNRHRRVGARLPTPQLRRLNLPFSARGAVRSDFEPGSVRRDRSRVAAGRGVAVLLGRHGRAVGSPARTLAPRYCDRPCRHRRALRAQCPGRATEPRSSSRGPRRWLQIGRSAPPAPPCSEGGSAAVSRSHPGGHRSVIWPTLHRLRRGPSLGLYQPKPPSCHQWWKLLPRNGDRLGQ